MQNPAATTKFNVARWLSSRLLFTPTGDVNARRPRREISQHLPRHRLDCPVCGGRLQSQADLSKISIAASRESQHQGTKHLLSDVERINTFFSHAFPLAKKT